MQQMDQTVINLLWSDRPFSWQTFLRANAGKAQVCLCVYY